MDLVTLAAELRRWIPGRASGGYRPPTAGERERFVEAAELVAAGEVARADTVLHRMGYDAVRATEAETGDALLLVVERVPVEVGWGTYVRRVTPASATDVHVNHLVYDLETHRVGARVFRACACRWLFVAGTHRYANSFNEADMARSTSSIFQAMYEAVAGSGRMALSVHGFSPANHGPPTSETDVVLSLGVDADGDSGVTPEARDLRRRIRGAGYSAGLVADDPGYDELTGSPNPQGRWANTTFGHGRWIHVELTRDLRESETHRVRLGGVLGAWLAEVAGSP